MEKKVIEHAPVAFPYNDYVQSANTLFHFMSKSEHLEWILKNRAIAPRYCVEDKKALYFKKESYYMVHILMDGMEAAMKRIDDKAREEAVAAVCEGKT